MPRLLVPLALALLTLTGCSSLEMPGSAMYFANQPAGAPFFRITSTLGSPSIAVYEFGTQWTKSRKMTPVGPNEPPFATTPGFYDLVKSAYQVDSYVFIEFKPGAKLHGQEMPSRYFLFPGGFAYPVPAPGR